MDEQKNKLRSAYKISLEKAKILISKKGDIFKKRLPDDVQINDEKYFTSDGKGNLYVRDDIY